MSILVVMREDATVNGSPYYAGQMYVMNQSYYRVLRKAKLLDRCLAKCRSPKGRVYWLEACKVRTGMPSCLKTGHEVIEPWFDPRIHRSPGSTIQASTRNALTATVNVRNRGCGGCSQSQPEKSHATRSRLVASAGSQRLRPEQEPVHEPSASPRDERISASRARSA